MYQSWYDISINNIHLMGGKPVTEFRHLGVTATLREGIETVRRHMDASKRNTLIVTEEGRETNRFNLADDHDIVRALLSYD